MRSRQLQKESIYQTGTSARDRTPLSLVEQLKSQVGIPLLLDLFGRDRLLEFVRAGWLGSYQEGQLGPRVRRLVHLSS